MDEFFAGEQTAEGNLARADVAALPGSERLQADADGTELDGLAIAFAAEDDHSQEIVVAFFFVMDLQVDFGVVKLVQARCHVAVVDEQVALRLRHGTAVDEGERGELRRVLIIKKQRHEVIKRSALVKDLRAFMRG